MPSPLTRQDVSGAIAAVMPMIMRGIQLDFFVTKGVTQTQFFLLMAIHASNGCPMGVLAQSLHVSMPTATGIVDRLVRSGHVKRCVLPHDRRCVVVALTPKGERFIAEFEMVIRRRWEDVLRSLTRAELAALYGVMTTLRERLDSGVRA